ncbi:hypothetical protein [Fortiea contorta]|uniref:hypothetical protein n=1 Tax=Fortiea contorta TaxID=1892405 RepID=UPI00034B02B3|nr:hypothetical protein [Fortiea contorta]
MWRSLISIEGLIPKRSPSPYFSSAQYKSPHHPITPSPHLPTLPTPTNSLQQR